MWEQQLQNEVVPEEREPAVAVGVVVGVAVVLEVVVPVAAPVAVAADGAGVAARTAVAGDAG